MNPASEQLDRRDRVRAIAWLDPVGGGDGSIGGLSPTADGGALIITFPRAWTAEQRLEFMADVARALPRERWAHVGELMCTDSIAATAPERRAVFARLTARRARGVDALTAPVAAA